MQEMHEMRMVPYYTTRVARGAHRRGGGAT